MSEVRFAVDTFRQRDAYLDSLSAPAETCARWNSAIFGKKLHFSPTAKHQTRKSRHKKVDVRAVGKETLPVTGAVRKKFSKEGSLGRRL